MALQPTISFAALCERKWFCLSIIFIVAAAMVVAPLLMGGLHASGDLQIYLSFGQEFSRAFANGEFLPGWADNNLGYGSVGIRFYPPMAAALTALTEGLIGSWYDAIRVYFLIWMGVGGWGAYFFVRDWGSGLESTCAGVLYAIVPFPIAEIYQFSLYAEFAAGALIPYCFLFATRLCLRTNRNDVIGFAISFSLLILTHIPTTIILSVTLLIYIVVLERRKLSAAIFARFSVASLLALLSSSFYWVNVVFEVNWLKHSDDKYSSGLEGYEYWLFPNTLFKSDAPYYYLPLFRHLDAIIVLTGLMFVPLFVQLMLGRGRENDPTRRLLVSIAATAGAGFFMLSKPSAFIWAQLDILQKIQFPWRWLTVLSVQGVIAFSLGIPRLVRTHPGYKKFAVLCALGLISLTMVYNVRQSFMKPNRVSPDEFAEILNDTSPNEGTNFEAWWPTWAKSGAFEVREKLTAPGRSVDVSTWERTNRHFRIGDGAAGFVRVATFYYPHWQATVNGREVTVDRDMNGVVLIPVGPEASAVELRFNEPTRTVVARWFSIGTWVLLLLMLLGHLLWRSGASQRQVLMVA